ncbi:MAG: hypothetical protein AAF495_26015 [Pseudomonadota bacterium]
MYWVVDSTTKMPPGGPAHKRREPELWPYWFWAGVAAIAFVTAVGVSPPWLQALLEGGLWCIAVFFAAVMGFALSELPWFSKLYSGSRPIPLIDSAKEIWFKRSIYAVIVLSLTAGGYYWLAGLFFALPLVVDGYRLYAQVLIAGTAPEEFSPADRAIYWLAVFLSVSIRAPFKILAFVLKSPWHLWRFVRYRVSDRKLAGLFREELGDRDILIYLVFSEPHQLSHFLGGDGVLHPFLDNVLARDWRKDIMPHRRASRWATFAETAEGAMLKRFGISNLREHLPFVLVVSRDGEYSAHHLGEAYRQRSTEKGQSLLVLETALRSRIEATLHREYEAAKSSAA